MAREPHHIFVYGSLLSSLNGPAHVMLHPGSSFVATGWIGGRLYDTGDYPALASPGNSGKRVQGEIYALTPGEATRVLARLDRFEGYLPDDPGASLFLRVQSEALLASGEGVQAWIYVYNRSVDGLSPIPSGDYTAYVRAQAT